MDWLRNIDEHVASAPLTTNGAKTDANQDQVSLTPHHLASLPASDTPPRFLQPDQVPSCCNMSKTHKRCTVTSQPAPPSPAQWRG